MFFYAHIHSSRIATGGFKTKKNTTMKKSDRQKARHIRKLMEACHRAGIKTFLIRDSKQLDELTSNINLN